MFRNTSENSSVSVIVSSSQARSGEKGAALATALLMLALLSAIAMTVLAVVRTETRIAGSDLKRTQTFYAAASGIEKMTSDFSQLHTKTSRPTTAQLYRIKTSPPVGLASEGYTLLQDLDIDQTTLDDMKTTQGIPLASTTLPNAVMGADSPFAGLNASVKPYTLTTRATGYDGTQVALTRQMNNYLIPIFQFGVFSDKDLEFWPQPPMIFNGRVHANGNIYFGGDVTFLQRVTTANEAVRDKLRNNAVNNTLVGGGYASDPRFKLNSTTTVSMTQGSVTGGPNILTQPRTDGRGNFPDSPTGLDNTWWKTNSKTAFGGLLLTKSTGVLPLKLPLQLQEINKQPMELIKRTMPDDALAGMDALNDSRYQNKAQIRILIDDENAGNGAANAAGIPAGKGVLLSQFIPSVLDGGRALRVVTDAGAYASVVDWYQGRVAQNRTAQTVRMVRNDYNGATLQASSTSAGNTGGLNATATEYTNNLGNAALAPYRTPNGAIIPTGSGITGRILIEIVPPTAADGTPQPAIDVTQAVLSMGVTVGEPNGIVYLQRPEWAALMQGSRDRNGDGSHHNYLTYFLDNSVATKRAMADGEINKDVAFDVSGYIFSNDNNLDDDTHSGGTPFLPDAASMARDDKPGPGLNKIVPINVYNVREGHVDEASDATIPYQRGITSVVEINMRNLARWVDGVYDTNLFNGISAATSPVSANIGGDDGYVVYLSDRRGDRVKGERDASGAVIQTTNGMADNEDIYNVTTPALDPGEDVIDDGVDPATGVSKKNSLQLDKCELPTQAALASTGVARPNGAVTAGVDSTDYALGMTVTEWKPALPASMSAPCSAAYATANNYWFRRAVRVFNGENLQITGNAGKLSTTKGITISTENMVYVWGNFNTTGINQAPGVGQANLNDPAVAARYNGNQVPASIVADAFFPLSKTWYDALPAMHPDGSTARVADAGPVTDSLPIAVTDETAVRAGIIAGATLSSMTSAASAPGYYLDNLNGGVHNFPRFLETWGNGSTWFKRWNYVGSFIILYNSHQANGPWSVVSSIVYYPPIRNWAFDITFTDPMRLPPGTPQFQHVEPTGFRQIL